MHRWTIILTLIFLAGGIAAAQSASMTSKQMVEKGSTAAHFGQFDEALRWYRAGAELDDPEAEDALGQMYLNGSGVREDLAEALAWFRKAADKDDPGAETYLGIMFSSGWGVRQDYAVALKWYLKAAKHGDVVAAENIGMMYLNGLGPPADFEKARPWFHQAIAGGNTLPIPILCDPSRASFVLAERHSDVVAMDRVISQTDAYCTDLLAEMKARRDTTAKGRRPTNR